MIPENMRVPVMVGLFVVVGAILAFQFLGGGGAGPAPASGMAAAAGDTQFIEVDFDLAALVKNIEEVRFRYSEVRESRNPMTPLIGAGQGGTVIPGDIATIVDTLPQTEREAVGNIIYEANRKQVVGIVWDETKPIAIISDRTGDTVVRVGDRFEGGIVVNAITLDSVVLTVSIEGKELEIVRELQGEDK